jgi:hypothetical protein
MSILGVKVTDSITGFSGIVISRTEYLHGCARVGVESDKLRDGKPLEVQYFDEPRMVISTATGPTFGFPFPDSLQAVHSLRPEADIPLSSRRR